MKPELQKIMSLLLCFFMVLGVLPGMSQDEHIHFESDHTHEEIPYDESEEPIGALEVCEDALGFMLSLFAVPVYAAYEDGVECDHCGSWRYDDWKCDNGDHCGEGSGTSCYEEHHCGYCGACDDDHEMCDDCGNCLEDHCECDEKCRGCYETSGDVCDVCGEKCTECVDFICDDCGICAECAGNELYCSHCMLCIGCADWLCYCGEGCSECAVGCPGCREKCNICAEDELCQECFYCWDCMGGEGNYCRDCRKCKDCVDVVCYNGDGCSECVLVCEECGEKCENCADGGVCGKCGVCADCAGSYCAYCDLCERCVEWICYCGEGCAQCVVACPGCFEKCSSCAEEELCQECFYCFECMGGEGNYCPECRKCKDCVDVVCYNGDGCSECVLVCEECGEKCENCADGGVCGKCGVCADCAGGYCVNCDLCENCVEQICYCGEGCSNCVEMCPECFEKCMHCADDEMCAECGLCWDCVGGEGNYCADCGMCKNCVEVCNCGNGCVDCTSVCEECGEKCLKCTPEEICSDCGICRDCIGGDGNYCDVCRLCKNCVDYICFCSGGCSECTTLCMECCEVCVNCSEELCQECGTCRDCSDTDGFCVTCGLCSDCGIVCPCGEGCENCADLCPECGEVCSSCSDEFCASCDLCRACTDDLFCEECYQCGNCTEVCEDCGIVCTDCAESVCDDCGKCSGCIDVFCPDCGICMDCADAMCQECHFCGDCTNMLCGDCGEYCPDCTGFCTECGKCENCIEICPDCELCGDCCAERAEEYGCSHEICPESEEWKKHYCTSGNHCAGNSAKTDHNESEHWTLCGEGCDVKLNVETHRFGEGKVTKEATKKADGVMKLTCTECGYTKEESIPKLTGGHTHEYTSTVTEPTCQTGGYTTHTCSCGHSWTDGGTAPVKHNDQYQSTETKHWQECTFCHKTTEKSIHKLGEWKTVVKPGYTFAGEKQRMCKICGYAVCESIPMLTVPDHKQVITIPNFPISDPEQKVDTGESDVEVAASIMELLTKGSDNTVPALPVLMPKEEGNQFEGWVNKATGEPVKKGDKLTENIELEPVFKDCGKDNHSDGNEDNACDECGYILMKAEFSIEREEDDTGTAEQNGTEPAGGQDADHEEIPTWFIWIITVGGSVVVVCGAVLLFVLMKKKGEEYSGTEKYDSQNS